MLKTVLSLIAALPLLAEVTTLPLIPSPGAPPIYFEARSEGVREGPQGYTVEGDTALVGLGRRLVLTSANLFFEFAPGTREIRRVRGEAFVPSPYEGPDAQITKPARAQFGMDFGVNLDYGIPLNPDRVYFYFKFDAGFELLAGPLTLAIPVGVNALFLLDPTDPFFFIAGGLLKPEGDTPPPDSKPAVLTGFGASSQSLIPFRPAVTHGIEHKVREFSGNQIISGTLPLGKLPVIFSGQMISDIHQIGTGQKAIDPLDIGLGPWAQAGINGSFEFGFPFLKVKKLGNLASFGFELGNATAAMEVVEEVQHAYFSGDIDPDLEWIPEFIPIKPDGRLVGYAYVSSAGNDFVLKAEGNYAINAATLGQYTGIQLGDIFNVEGSLSVSVRGFHLTGETNDNLGSLGYSQHRRVELFIPFDESRPGFLRLDGMNQVLSLRIQGTALLTKGLASIEGRLDTNQIEIAVRAAIEAQPNGPTQLTGTFSIPAAWNEALQGTVLAEANAHKDAIGKVYDDFKKSTEGYEFELSLRGMRTVIPGVCDAILNTLNAAERTAHSRINQRWPRFVPGKGSAKSRATSEINAHRNRIRNLKSRVLTGDSAAVRSALVAAIHEVLGRKVLVIRVNVIGEVHRQQIINSSTENRLRTALAGVQALPAASNRKVKAEAAWKAAPKREELVAAADAIIAAAIDRIPAIRYIGFAQPLGQPVLNLFADVAINGKVSRHTLPFDPANPLAVGSSLGKLVTAWLN